MKDQEKTFLTPSGLHVLVGEWQGDGPSFDCYSALEQESGRPVLVKAAKKHGTLQDNYNEALFMESLLLSMLQDEAARLEKEHKETCKRRKVPYRPLRYDYLFTQCLEAFSSEAHDGRTVSVIGFTSPAITDAGKLTILSRIGRKYGRIIGAKSGAWPMGKGLKGMVCGHEHGIHFGHVELLLETDLHLPMFVHLENGHAYSGDEFTPDMEVEDIQQLARLVTLALGGNLKTGVLPEDPHLKDERYATLLHDMVLGLYTNAVDAHTAWYKLIRGELWPENDFFKFQLISVPVTEEA